ncbi:unnamed protein product [Calypogeia fissa]
MATKVNERWHEKENKQAGKSKPAAIAEEGQVVDSSGIPRLDYNAFIVLQNEANKVRAQWKAKQELAASAEGANKRSPPLS